jgi:hypothetical protein
MMKNLSQIKIEVLCAAESPNVKGRRSKIPAVTDLPNALKGLHHLRFDGHPSVVFALRLLSATKLWIFIHC